MADENKDYEAYRTYVNLWAGENPVKTSKFQVLLIVNALLVCALQVSGGFSRSAWPVFLVGGVFSFIWVLSIGRTSIFQKIWQLKAKRIATAYEDDPRFQVFDTRTEVKNTPAWLRFLGSVSSRSYLLGVPLLFTLIWFGCLAYVLF